jgi:hypothetical protein
LTLFEFRSFGKGIACDVGQQQSVKEEKRRVLFSLPTTFPSQIAGND